ncbi:hypothetical protein LZ30DRAFT_775792 [Colletotrichum cereale]|nr:hypothetical protein LZ30DRAFT_775792 [Colletotrichum cereale]
MEDIKDYISDFDSDGLPDDYLRSLHRHKRNWSLERCALVFFILLNVFLVLSHVTEWARGYAISKNSYENGFESDLASIKGLVETYQTSFQGGVTVDGHGQFSIGRDGEEYAGKPSPTVDDAWNTLLAGSRQLTLTTR